ncbi:MAG: cell division protein FtsB [Burkholderiaceae bacterium]|nr:cell division protein FtsB [Burkholderiaceae bacterium]
MLTSRRLSLLLLAILIVLQWYVWFGKGGWLKVWERQAELAKREAENLSRKQRNAAIEADVADLKSATGAVEERARQELGMIKQGEVFVQVLDARSTTP